MNKLDDIFGLDEQGQIILDKKRAKMIESVKEVIKRDYENDRYHKDSLNQLSYAYLILDKDSYGNYSPEERPSIIRQRLGVPAEWKPWAETERVITEFAEDFKTVEQKMLDSFEANAYEYIDILNEIRENNKRLNAFLKIPIEKLTTEQVAQRQQLLSQTATDFSTMVDYTKQLSVMITEIRKYKELVNMQRRKEGTKRENTLETDHKRYERKSHLI